MTPRVLGQPLNRHEGRRKVTGAARYAADNGYDRMAHACGVFSPIAAGRIRTLDCAEAERAPGVLAVLHHGNIPKLRRCPDDFDRGLKPAEERTPFEDDTIHYAGQFVAVVVAETFEQARWAAHLVRAEYRATAHVLSLDAGKAQGGAKPQPEEKHARGDLDAALSKSTARIDATYTTPVEAHCAMELHATVARWEGDTLVVDDATQWVYGQPKSLAHVLGVPPDKVIVRAPFIGGAFGSKLFLWPHTILAAIAAHRLQRPVKFVLPRQVHFANTGHRPLTRQRIQLGATAEGRLLAIRHDSESHTSMVTDYVESCGQATASLYECPNVLVTQRLIPLNVGTPTPMRGPGTCPGSFALESALDELALELRLDPIELRLKNIPGRDPENGLPWSGIHFADCLRLAADRFGWARRRPEIGAMRDGGDVLGWGFAAATWSAERDLASARVELRADGTIKVSCGTQDIGTGTYTVVAQVVAELTGLPFERIEVELGNSASPRGPISGGSMATASIVPAVAKATRQAIARLPTPCRRVPLPLADGLRELGQECVAEEATTESGDERKQFSFRCFGAHCAEVRWDPGVTRLRVTRVVSVFDTGRIINRKTALNQLEGAIVMGLGMARLEQAVYDERTGRIVNDNLADYHVPVHADMPEIDVTLLDRPDPYIGEFGAKGLGEIGITGIAAAIANATFHATGRRVRDLPIGIERLLA